MTGIREQLALWGEPEEVDLLFDVKTSPRRQFQNLEKRLFLSIQERTSKRQAQRLSKKLVKKLAKQALWKEWMSAKSRKVKVTIPFADARKLVAGMLGGVVTFH